MPSCVAISGVAPDCGVVVGISAVVVAGKASMWLLVRLVAVVMRRCFVPSLAFFASARMVLDSSVILTSTS